MSDSYVVRSITFDGVAHGIVLQSHNGPCPLIAITNVLSLRGQVDLTSLTTITSPDLCNLIAEVHAFVIFSYNSFSRIDFACSRNDFAWKKNHKYFFSEILRSARD